MTRNLRSMGWLSGLAVILLFPAVIVPGCDPGGGGGSSGGVGPAPPPANTVPSAIITTPAAPQGGNVAISYDLLDDQSNSTSILVEYSTNGGMSFSPATAGPGGDGTTALASSPGGTAHTFVWNSLADGVAAGGPNSMVRLRITPSDADTGLPSNTGNFTVNNSANTPPSVMISTPPGTLSGLIQISYDLTDAQSNTCSIAVAFSTDGGVSFTSPATAGPGGDGTTLLASSPGLGTPHSYIWNSFADGVATGGLNSMVRIRITPSDGAAGMPVSTGNFMVNNSALSSGGSILGGYPRMLNSTVLNDSERSVAVDGRSMYVAGEDSDTGTSMSNSRWRIEKRTLIDGSLDGSFGSSGVITADPGAGEDETSKIVIDGTHMYIAGSQETGFATGLYVTRLEKRLLTTGALVGGFGTGGVVSGGNLGREGRWFNLAADASFLYFVFAENVSLPNDYRLRVEKRNKTNGALVDGFGSGGVVTDNVNPLADGALAAAVDGDFLYLAGFQDLTPSGGSNSLIRIEKRFVRTGILDPRFGASGAIVMNIDSANDYCTDIVVDGFFLYVFIEREVGIGTEVVTWRLEKRNTGDGMLTASVVATGGSGDSNEHAGNRLLIDGAHLFVAGTVGSADRVWRIEKRLLSNLMLVGTFGTGGVVSINPTPTDDQGHAIVTRGGVLFIAGDDDTSGGAATVQLRIEARWR